MAANKKTKKKAKKKSATKKAAKKTPRKKKSGKLQPRKDKRGLTAAEMVLPVDAPGLGSLVAEVENAGGAAIGGYREPLSGRALLLAALPLKAVQPTPFQRDLSPTHTKRLAQKIEESGSFLDPLIVVRGADGRLWTPNGRHRLAAAKMLGLEIDYANEFEAPELITLGIIYLENKRFAGGAYSPFLKKVDRFSERTLRVSLRERKNYAARLLEIETQVKRIIDGLQKRGFKSPYLRSYVVARINPVRFHRAKKGDTTPPMSMAAALTRMAAAAKKFDIDSVKFGELALVAAVASE
jgi:ParB family chromosome partitioning protein